MKKRDLFYLTRRTNFLWKSSGVLILILVALGISISFLNRARATAYQKVIATPQYVDEHLRELGETHENPMAEGIVMAAIEESLKSDAAFHKRILKIAHLLYFVSANEPLSIPLIENLSPNQQMIAEALVTACSNPDDESSIQLLEKIAGTPTPVSDANFALALAFDTRENDDGVIKALLQEIEIHDSRHARERLVQKYLALEKFDALEKLEKDAEYKELITPFVQHDIALNNMDWPTILRTHFMASYERTNPAMVILAILSGLVWATLLMRFNSSLSMLKFSIPALVLGALSAHATLLFIYWQEYQLGFGMGNDTVSRLLYCVLGIGLREEALKLLLFVPLIPFLLKRSDLEILTVAGLVGLGFAIEENINYFEVSAGLSAVGRFATANFLHIALTAMCGLTLTRAVVHRGEDIQHAAVVFVLAVATHGLYDAFIMVPALMSYSWLTYTVFVLMGYQYFGWLHHLRDRWKDPISITSTFTYGIILVTGLSFILYAWNSGPLPAFKAVAHEALGVAVILVMFYREIPETLEG